MIGVFGGTFDPVHFGHLRPALDVKQALNLAEMRLVPAFIPPHRAQPIANPGQRLTMLRAAVGNESDLLVDNCEMKREGISYMVETLTALRADKGVEPICLVLGVDAFLQFDSWHRWQDILGLAHLVVIHRPGWTFDAALASTDIQQLWQQHHVPNSSDLEKHPVGKVWFQTVTQLDISATKIRNMVAEGENPRFMVPDAVWNLIRMNALYGRIAEDSI